MKTKLFIILFIIIPLVLGLKLLAIRGKYLGTKASSTNWWEIQSIDTVKYSRDLAREKAKDSSFDEVIDTQVRLIAETGATHIAVGTPYAEEFVPFLQRWVSAARKYGLKVWFRGNVPGWERWFGYPKIDRNEHTSLVREFILANGALFEEGDIFSSCTECENGGPGDPRRSGDVAGHRNFLTEEYKITNDAFRKSGKNVRSNFAPMNGDVAALVMDEETTNSLGNIVVIDRYVGSTEKLAKDLKNIAEKSGGKVILGEFGAPISNIHANFNEEEQATWIRLALSEISDIPELMGVNYWTSFGGSTRLWDSDYRPRKAVEVIRGYYKPRVVEGLVSDERGKAVKKADVIVGSKQLLTTNSGIFVLPVNSEKVTITIQADGYITQQLEIDSEKNIEIILIKGEENILFKIQKFIYQITH